MPYVNYKRTTDFTPEDIAYMLATNDAFMESAILALHDRQRELERRVRETFYKNEEGLQVADARLFSRYAEYIRKQLARGVKLGNCMTDEMKHNARRPWRRPRRPIPTICKYRWQVLEIIEMNAKRKQ